MASGLLLLALGPAGSGLLVRLPEPAPADSETVLCPAGCALVSGQAADLRGEADSRSAAALNGEPFAAAAAASRST